MTASTQRRSTDRDYQSRGTPDDDHGPRWPPRPGTKVSVYLPSTQNPLYEYRCEVEGFNGSVLTLTTHAGAPKTETGIDAKVFFSGNATGWGYDGDIVGAENGPVTRWQIQIRKGPIEVDRRESRRVPERTIVLLKCGDAVVPAHILDRSDLGMRCISGRGAGIDIGKTVTVKTETIQGLFGVEGAVVWRRPTPHGIEYGVCFS